MLRVKAPQGIMSSLQARVFADIAARYSRGFCHVTTRQNMQFHFVLLKDAEPAMREMAAAGLTTREACGNAVRNVTGCPYAGTSASEVFEVAPYAEVLTRYFLRHPLAASLPRKFKIAFEGCAEDHAFASINDIGWRARIVDGRRGFRVTVAGGTSIMPVSGYLLYEFLPVEEMLNVAEAVLRVFHRHGDYEHRQRNRMKFTVKALGWDAFKAKFEEYLAEFKAAGGAPLVLSEDALRPRNGPGLGAPDRAVHPGRGRRVGHAGHRSRHRAGNGEAADRARCLRALAAHQRGAAEAGRLSPRDRATAARRHHVRASCACWPIWPRRTATARCASRCSRTSCSGGCPPSTVEPFYQRLMAADLGHLRRDDAGRRRELPGCGELPPGRDAVARARTHADRVPERAPRSGRRGAVGHHQDQRLPERMRPAPRGVDRVPGQCPQGGRQGRAAVLRDGGRWLRRRREGALRQGGVEGARAPPDDGARAPGRPLQGTAARATRRWARSSGACRPRWPPRR